MLLNNYGHRLSQQKLQKTQRESEGFKGTECTILDANTAIYYEWDIEVKYLRIARRTKINHSQVLGGIA